MQVLKRITLTVLVVYSLTLGFNAIGQVPPPPPAGGHGQSGNREGGAPIGGGLFILLGLAAAYGGKKLYDIRKEKLEE